MNTHKLYTVLYKVTHQKLCIYIYLNEQSTSYNDNPPSHNILIYTNRSLHTIRNQEVVVSKLELEQVLVEEEEQQQQEQEQQEEEQ